MSIGHYSRSIWQNSDFDWKVDELRVHPPSNTECRHWRWHRWYYNDGYWRLHRQCNNGCTNNFRYFTVASLTNGFTNNFPYLIIASLIWGRINLLINFYHKLCMYIWFWVFTWPHLTLGENSETIREPMTGTSWSYNGSPMQKTRCRKHSDPILDQRQGAQQRRRSTKGRNLSHENWGGVPRKVFSRCSFPYQILYRIWCLYARDALSILLHMHAARNS